MKLSPEGGVFQSDQSDEVFSITKPIALARDIDMKKCLLGSVKDSTVIDFVRNTGNNTFRVDSIYFRGTDANAFSLVSALPKYTIAAGGKHNAEFRFKPLRVGIHTAEIVIVTQADTLIRNIKGECVQPQVSIENAIIDFGKVGVGTRKDSLQVVTIKNIGTTPLNITNTKHNRPNLTDFTTIAGGGNFTLAPDENRKMYLRFKPSDVGRTSGMLEFYYNGVGSPAGVQLYGEGVKGSPQILTNAEKFADLICELTTSADVEIKNTGGEPLIITEINFKGNNPNDFGITEKLPITVAPDSTKTLAVIFKPLSPGTKTAYIELISNALPDAVLTLQITAKKDSVSIMPEATKINLGTLCPNEAKDTVIVLNNSGTIGDVGYVEYTSLLSSSLTGFTIDSNSTFQLPLRFEGLANEGVFSEKVTITDSVCGRKQEIIITGTIALPVITTKDVTITAVIGSYNNGKIIIRNNSKRDYTITNVVGLVPPFELAGNPFPLDVEVNSTVEIAIKYTPDDDKEDALTVSLIGEPCNLSQDVKINGRMANFLLIYPENTQTGLGVEINFKWSLVSWGEYYQLQISKNDQFTDLVYSMDSITATEHFVPDLEPEILYYWRVRVWSEETIGTAIWSDVWTFTTGTAGVNDESVGIKIVPNPAGDYITVTLKPSEGFEPSEGSAIQIYNALGEKVLSESIHPMTASHRMNIESLPKGIYFVKVGDETAKFVKM